MQALLSLDCIPTGMELFPAADDESWELIKRFIAGCDYYIVIVSGRYGSRSADGRSYTEMEYDFAVEASLPVLAFLQGDPGGIASKNTEATAEGKAALEKFREKIKIARHAKYWTSPKDLALAVFQSMSSLMKTKPGVGWVRADLVADESAAQEILRLRKKIDELSLHIAQSELTAPPGTEDLSQGQDTISLHFRYELSGAAGYQETLDAFTWNEILSTLGPILISRASEGDLKEKLAEKFRNRLQDRIGAPIYHSYIRDEEFQKVKLQLRALGLISEIKHDSLTGDQALWTLTPHGDRVMTQVAAIRSSSKR